MDSLNVCTAPRNIPEQEWGWPSVSGLSNEQGEESGWNLNRPGVRHFTLQSRSGTASEERTGRKESWVLLVEDNPADAGLVRKALEEHGVKGQIIVLADGEMATQFIQCLDAQQVACPDLVILDLNIPKKPGREVLEYLRRSMRCRHVPIVILSSSDAQQDRADAARLGADRYIRKPSHLEEFLSLGAVFKETLGRSSR